MKTASHPCRSRIAWGMGFDALAHSIRCQAHRQDINSILVVYQRVGRTSGWAARRLVLSTPLTLFQVGACTGETCVYAYMYMECKCLCVRYEHTVCIRKFHSTGASGTLEHWNNWNIGTLEQQEQLELLQYWNNWNTGTVEQLGQLEHWQLNNYRTIKMWLCT